VWLVSVRIPRKSLSQINCAALTPFVLGPADEEDLERGIALFNGGKYWEAHEAWEEIWKRRPEDGRFFLQALIQLAAAYHQLEKKVYRGVLIHLKQTQERLRLFPSDYLRVDVSELLKTVDRSLSAIQSKRSLADVDWNGLEIATIQRA
jgi:uncharacterized protein